MPAGVVEHEDDAALAARTGLAGEGGEQFGEERLGEAAAEIPDRLAAGWLHEAGDVEPLVARVAEGDRPLAPGRRDPAPDRLQAEAVLVLRPDLGRPVGVRRPGRGDSGIEPPLKAARCSGVAARGCRGRGAWTDQPMRCSASQPRCGCTRSRPRCRAIQTATLAPLHSPPSSGGVDSRSARAASTSSPGLPPGRSAAAGRPAPQSLYAK